MARINDHLQEVKSRAILNLLNAKTLPNPLFTEEELGDCYQGLSYFLENKYDGSKLHKGHAQNNWEILEFQSSWHVLWKYHQDEEIKKLSDEERKQEYERKLTQNKNSFPILYPKREKAKKKLEELIII